MTAFWRFASGVSRSLVAGALTSGLSPFPRAGTLCHMKMSTYKGRVALVTGASSGIGHAVVEALVKEGMTVVGAARRVEKIEALSSTLKDEPGRVIAKKLDVSKPEEIEALFKTIETELNGVDVLVNCAGMLQLKPIHQLTTEEIKFVTDVNQIGVFVTAREAIKGWISRKIDDGFIVNVSSISGTMVPYLYGTSPGIYAPTKHAVAAGCKQLRHDLKDAGIKARVTCICPGAVDTDLMAAFRDEDGKAPGFLRPRDIAKAVAFVLSMPKTAEVTQIIVQPTGETY